MIGKIFHWFSNKRRPQEFQLIETDEWLVVDLNTIIGIKEEPKKMQHDITIPGLHLITQFGVIFWVKGDYKETRNLTFGKRKLR